MKTKKNQFKPVEELNAEDPAEVLVVNNGRKEMEVTRKAFNVIYQSKGFEIGELRASKVDDYDLNDPEIADPEIKQTPQQKAAATKAAKAAEAFEAAKAAALSGTGQASE